MSPKGINKESYVRPNGLRGEASRSPGTGTGYRTRAVRAPTVSEKMGERREREARHRQAQRDRLLPQLEKSPDAIGTWADVMGRFKKMVPESTFKIWFEDLRCEGVAEDALIVVCGRPRAITWIERRYSPLVGGIIRNSTSYRGFFLLDAEADSGTEDGCL